MNTKPTFQVMDELIKSLDRRIETTNNNKHLEELVFARADAAIWARRSDKQISEGRADESADSHAEARRIMKAGIMHLIATTPK
jgi:hypothetical protein